MNLEDLNRSVKAHTKRKRRGRGRSSGIGKTGGRGGKGQSARSGWDRQVGFEGGQMPIYRRLPRRGFSNARFADADVSSINVDRLAKFEAGSVVNQDALVAQGVINRFKGSLKILGGGDLKVALTVEAQAFSSTAKEKIEKAGGKAVVIAASKASSKPEAEAAAPKAEAPKAVKPKPVAKKAPTKKPVAKKAAPKKPKADGEK